MDRDRATREEVSAAPRRRRLRVVLMLLGLAAVLYAVVVWIASSRFIHVRDTGPLPDRQTPGLTEITATTSDGLTLRGSFLEPPDARGILVLFHGIRSERYRGTLPRVASWGLIGVSFDFRCHGASDGDVTTFGWEERRDVAAIVDCVRARWPGRKIAAWGISLGGAALCYAPEIVRDLDAVVLESVYADIDSAFERRVCTWAPRWTMPLAIPVKWVVGARLGLDPSTLRPVDFIARLDPNRVLVTTGERDPWAGPPDLEALGASLPGCSRHVVPGARHHDVWMVGGTAYADFVRAFIESRLR
jgi:pimeloyl-ACP methyl ester carboxylesterase